MTDQALSDAEKAELNPPAHYAITALLVAVTIYSVAVGAWVPAVMTAFFSVYATLGSYRVYQRTRQEA